MRIAQVSLAFAILCALEFSEGLNFKDLFAGIGDKEGCMDAYCTACQPGWIKSYQMSNPCVRSCPGGFYKAYNQAMDQYSCRRCRRNCNVCNDWLNCDVCNNGYALMATAFRRCVAKCPHNYVVTNTQQGHVCEKDVSGCVDERCTRCQNGLFILKDWRNSQCVDSCPVGYYSSQQGGTLTCEKCLYNCAKCSSYMSCDRCYPGFAVIADSSRVYCVHPRN